MRQMEIDHTRTWTGRVLVRNLQNPQSILQPRSKTQQIRYPSEIWSENPLNFSSKSVNPYTIFGQIRRWQTYSPHQQKHTTKRNNYIIDITILHALSSRRIKFLEKETDFCIVETSPNVFSSPFSVRIPPQYSWNTFRRRLVYPWCSDIVFNSNAKMIMGCTIACI